VHTKVVKKSGMPLFAQPKGGMPLGLKLSNSFSGGQVAAIKFPSSLSRVVELWRC
jgi:hypothetical protein